MHPPALTQGGELTSDETTIISGTLDLSAKTASSCMTPIAEVNMVPFDAPLDWETAAKARFCFAPPSPRVYRSRHLRARSCCCGGTECGT